MLNLLIADDEKVIRESIAKCLDWEGMGIQVVGCCANGLEALDCIIDESPDIIMTDINMPGLDGLELISKMQDIDREIEYIIISGYREFDFAKKAMELGVRRYLLKPVSEQQVLDAVRDAAKGCERRRSVKAALEERNKLRQQLTQYRRLYLQYAMLFQGDSLEQAVDTYLERFSGQEGGYFVASLTIRRLEEDWNRVRAMTARLVPVGVAPVTNFFYAKETLSVILHGSGEQAAGLFIKLASENGFHLLAHAGAQTSLKSCVRSLHQELTRHSRVYTVDDAGNAYELHSSGPFLEATQNLPEQLLVMAENGETEEMESHIRSCLAAVEELHALRAAGAHLLVGILTQSPYPSLAEDALEGVFDEIYRENHRDAIEGRVVAIALSLLRKDQGGNDLVQKVKSYVCSNLADSSLSLKRIAVQYAHANADYLSRLFVQETGEKFSHYLNRKRVEKAKQLLQEDAGKVYLVAEQVGLGHNPRYFCQVFKKYTGLTPSAYTETQKEKSARTSF